MFAGNGTPPAARHALQDRPHTTVADNCTARRRGYGVLTIARRHPSMFQRLAAAYQPCRDRSLA